MIATLAAIDVIEASLDEQLEEWFADEIWRHWICNRRTGVRIRVKGEAVELSGISVPVPWRRRRHLRLMIERWAARKAVEGLKGTISK